LEQRGVIGDKIDDKSVLLLLPAAACRPQRLRPPASMRPPPLPHRSRPIAPVPATAAAALGVAHISHLFI